MHLHANAMNVLGNLNAAAGRTPSLEPHTVVRRPLGLNGFRLHMISGPASATREWDGAASGAGRWSALRAALTTQGGVSVEEPSIFLG